MTLGRTLSFVLGAVLIPTIAMADDPVDPYNNTQTPAQQQPAQQAPATTTTNTVVAPAPAPAPAQQPVVVVPPPQQVQPTTTVVDTRTPNEGGTVVADQWNAPVFATGALVFAGSYGASAIVAGSSNHVGADRLYVPVVGPWLALNDWGDCPIDQPRCDTNTTNKVLLVADGVFQAAGVVTMVSGLLSPTTHTVYTARTAQKTHITPTSNGFAVLGSF